MSGTHLQQDSFLATRSAFAGWSAPSTGLRFARGAWLHADDGRRYLDFASGSGSLILGHGDRGAIEALTEQATRFAICPASEFRVTAVEEYLHALTAFAGGEFSRAVLCSSGSDAVEAAFKLALQYHHERGDTNRVHIIGREASYHGNTLFGLAAGGFVRRRSPYSGALPTTPKATSAHCYRCEFGLRPNACAVECASSVEEAFRAAGPSTVAAYVMEPIVGAALSAAVPDGRYMARVREICDRHGALLIADEVLTGFGRTGQAFAWQHWQVQPDILIVGKAISAGYFPLSGVITTSRVAETLRAREHYFENGQTHLFNPCGAAIGTYVLSCVQRQSLIERARTMGELLRERLRPLLDLQIVGDVRGLGLMTGIELVANNTTRGCFDPSQMIARRFAQLARQFGLIVYPSSGGARTLAGDHILLLPPLTIDEAEITYASECLQRAADELSEQIHAGKLDGTNQSAG